MKHPNIQETYAQQDGRLTMDGYKLLNGFADGIDDATAGVAVWESIKMRSPDGTVWTITMSNAGALVIA